MDTKLEKYYLNRFALFETEGWKEFIEDVKELQAPLENIRSVKSVEMLHFRQGQLDIIQWLLTQEAAFEEAYKGLQEDASV